MGFERLGLSDATLAAVKASGYTDPTPIQAQAIPQVLMGRDVLGIAQTGTGKTAGFTLPMIDILAEGRPKARMPRSLILEPTRELAAQVADAFKTYGQNHKLNMALLIGGVNFNDQEQALERGADVLIATPGRLLDHFGRGKLLLNGLDILVVDEADRMLDMGFIPDVERICSLITKQHQTLFFSATMPPPIDRLTKQFLNDPKKIEVSRPASTAATIKEMLVHTGSDAKSKRDTLRKLVAREDIQNGIIFCNRKKDVSIVYESLQRHGLSVGQLHGDMAQVDRLEVLQGLKDDNIQLLVASDVAARGLDIAAVSHVFNYDVPNNADDYVHRVGRTGRAGREGKAFTLVSSNKVDQKAIEAIAKLTQKEFETLTLDEKGADKAPVATAAKDDQKGDSPSQDKPRARRRGGRGRKADADKKVDNGAPDAGADQAGGAAAQSTDNSGSASAAQTPGDQKPDNQPRAEEDTGRKSDAKSARESEKPARGRAQENRRDNRKNANAKGGRGGRQNYRQSDFESSDWPKEPVVGMGPHIPEFLRHPVDIKR
ncbi:DEAD/DEAH box helicase [Yunchengibacter salinarum]|uniref:DEAD/DEAH box helicase n=1 Tax=Yunchengibacter salinarum TaxID=3133399 RepID=UPI0035B5C29A